MSALPPRSVDKRVARTKPTSDFKLSIADIGYIGWNNDSDAVRMRWERIVAR